MRTIFLIIKHEIIITFQKPSFWVMAFLFPALLLGLNLVSQSAGEKGKAAPGIEPSSTSIGYVDEAGLIGMMPPSLPEHLLTRYADGREAEAAMQAGEIDQWVQIPADYAQSRHLTVTMHTFNPLGSTPESLFHYLIAYNLTGDEASAVLLTHPSGKLEAHTLAAQTTNPPLASALPYTVLMVFFFFFTFSSSLMLNSVSREKVNRTAEVLLLSLEPRDLMVGKILGLSVVALVQMLVWAGGGILLFNRGAALFQSLSIAHLPASLLVWVVVFFLLGYLMAASLMGAAGALAPSLREAGQVTFIIILPMMVPMLLSTAFSEDPNSILPVLLSLLPFTAPTAMIARLVLVPVPAWQIALSLGLLALTTGLIIHLSARAFRPDTLLSYQPISVSRLLDELTHRSAAVS